MHICPLIEECEKSCNTKNCTKLHRKLCRYGQRCRHQDKCSYKHRESQTFDIHIEDLTSLQIKVKELLEYKIKSEAKIQNLEKELKSSLLKKDKKNIKDDEFIEREIEKNQNRLYKPQN